MNTEYEVRILEIDVPSIKRKLDDLNATLEWDRVQKRYVYDLKPKNESKWIRLRTDGDKTTLTIKEVKSHEIDGTKELEIEVDDFDKCNLMLEELGYKHRGYQENRRVRYNLKGVEIDIDYWPLIPTYLEIEGKNAEEVHEIVELLGYNKDDVTSKDVESIYIDYGYSIDEIYDLKLEDDRK